MLDGPDRCGSVGWAMSHKVKGPWFDSLSGYMPWLQVWFPSRVEATDRCFSPSLSPSLPLALKIYEQVKSF